MEASLVLGIDEILIEFPLLKGAWICQPPKGLRYTIKRQDLPLSKRMDVASAKSVNHSFSSRIFVVVECVTIEAPFHEDIVPLCGLHTINVMTFCISDISL